MLLIKMIPAKWRWNRQEQTSTKRWNANASHGLQHYHLHTASEKRLRQIRKANRTNQAMLILKVVVLSLIHISEPTRLRRISYAVFCLKKKKKKNKKAKYCIPYSKKKK